MKLRTKIYDKLCQCCCNERGRRISAPNANATVLDGDDDNNNNEA